LHKDAKFKVGQAGSPYIDCVITDLSFKGAKINTHMKLLRDTFAEISIILAENVVLNVEAWIVWHKTVDGINSYGVYFSKIQDHDKEKIYRFICSNYPKQLNEKRWYEPSQEEKEGKDMEDRRIFQRFSVERPVRFLDMDSGSEGKAMTLDISAKGIGLVSSSELKPRAALEMWLEVADKEEPIYTRGEVVWSRKTESGNFTAGINLEKANLMDLSRLLR
jgi:hypothetical protein